MECAIYLELNTGDSNFTADDTLSQMIDERFSLANKAPIMTLERLALCLHWIKHFYIKPAKLPV